MVDYFIVSHSLFQNILDFQVYDIDFMLSDCHCPLSVQLQCYVNKCALSEQAGICYIEKESKKADKVIWKKDNRLKFIENLDVDKVQELCEKLYNISVDNIDIDNAVEDCNNILLNAAKLSGNFIQCNSKSKFACKKK